jgi:hypothetical protein
MAIALDSRKMSMLCFVDYPSMAMPMDDVQKDSFLVRRILRPRNDGTAHVFEIPFKNRSEGVQLKKILKEWIALYTVGEFYLGHNVLCFYTDKDAVAFKIADCVGKATAEYELKKKWHREFDDSYRKS